jgi:CarD family transcriptional regulator, regulator of rRNA transcription
MAQKKKATPKVRKTAAAKKTVRSATAKRSTAKRAVAKSTAKPAAKSVSKSAAKKKPAKTATSTPARSKTAASTANKTAASTAKMVAARKAMLLAASQKKKAAGKSNAAKAAPAAAKKGSAKSVTAAVKPGAAKSALAPAAKQPIKVGAGAPRAAAALAKTAGQKLTAPVATPKAIAQKAAASRELSAAQRKSPSQRHGFKTNEFIVYPAHGVGRIVGIEEQEIAGMSLELFVINFDKEKLTLRVPTGKLESVGMRKLAEEPIVKKAMDTLKGRARVKRTMWSRRAQEYVAKINSGDLISIAEVVRDLYRSEAQPEQSYSERQLYEDALDRMAREIAAVEKLDDRGAVQRITDILSKSARGRRLAEGADGESKAA